MTVPLHPNMPKLTRVTSTNPYRYSNNGLPGSLGSSTMSYYPTRGAPAMTQGYYETIPSSAPQMSMAMPSYDHYAVTPLTIPPTTHIPAVSGSLPTQHRTASTAWTSQDDADLLQLRASGKNWKDIHEWLMENTGKDKSANACRKRHERLIASRNADDWDARKMQRMAKEYMSMRKEIWAPLAQRTGEKWNVVEQKCMSSGIKNLQAAARAFTRLERLESGQPVYDDDSGIDGIGLTPVEDMETHPYSSPEASSGGGGHSVASGSSTVSHSGAYHGLPMHSQGSYQGYYNGGSHNHHHGYTSSVSSLGTAHGPNAGGSSYLDRHDRLPSVDMGIGSIINRQPNDRDMLHQ